MFWGQDRRRNVFDGLKPKMSNVMYHFSHSISKSRLYNHSTAKEAGKYCEAWSGEEQILVEIWESLPHSAWYSPASL